MGRFCDPWIGGKTEPWFRFVIRRSAAMAIGILAVRSPNGKSALPEMTSVRFYGEARAHSGDHERGTNWMGRRWRKGRPKPPSRGSGRMLISFVIFLLEVPNQTHKML